MLAHLVVAASRERSILWAVRGSELELVTDRGSCRVVDADSAWVEGPPPALARRDVDGPGPPELDIPWELSGAVQEIVVREGDEVEVVGDLTTVPFDSGYRSGSESAIGNRSRRPIVVRLLRRA